MANQRSDQESELKPRPVAVCTRCGAVSYSTEMISGQCAQVTVGKRCTGVIGSAPNQADWEICPACQATGHNGKMPCGQCGGTGWLYVRNASGRSYRPSSFGLRRTKPPGTKTY